MQRSVICVLKWNSYGENGGLGDVEHAPDGDAEWIQLLLLQKTHHLPNVQQTTDFWAVSDLRCKSQSTGHSVPGAVQGN